MKIQYTKAKNFHAKTQIIIVRANEIIEQFQAMGYNLTLRQLYYQFVKNNWLENTAKSYVRLSGVITDARLAGLVSWQAIEDRTRSPQQNGHWNSISELLETCADQFQIDKRSTQEKHIEVWVEKEALADVVRQACAPLDVLSFACKGYVSSSAMWRAAMRIEQTGKPCIILHLGDHDPSGMHMTDDIENRLYLLSNRHTIYVKRIALNMNQIQQYNAPPNYAKLTDPRACAYIAQYGTDSWELDALPPNVITDLITDEVGKLTDAKKFKTEKQKERNMIDELQQIADDLE